MHGEDDTCGEVILGAKLIEAHSAVDSNAPGEQHNAWQYLHVQLHCEEWRILLKQMTPTIRSASVRAGNVQYFWTVPDHSACMPLSHEVGRRNLQCVAGWMIGTFLTSC